MASLRSIRALAFGRYGVRCVTRQRANTNARCMNMKAISVRPGEKNSAQLRELPWPTLSDSRREQAVLAEVVTVGLCASDRAIFSDGSCTAPHDADFLVPGHENLCRIKALGSAVRDLSVAELIVFMVRRPGDSVYDELGMHDLSTDAQNLERGICGLHGFLSEQVVDDQRYAIRVPASLGTLGVFVEPTSVVEKAIRQAYLIQQRLGIWQPKRALVLGAGPVGLLATMVLRLRGLDVLTWAEDRVSSLPGRLVEQLGARYVSAHEHDLPAAAAQLGPVDLILEATGYGPLLFQAMDCVGKNGVLVLTGVTSGQHEADGVAADRLMDGFVMGNKVVVGSVNAARVDFEQGVADLMLAQARWPSWLARLRTHRVTGLQQYLELAHLLLEEKSAIKICVDVTQHE